MRMILSLIMALIVVGCSSHSADRTCQGEVASLAGQPLGTSQALITDRVSSFYVKSDQLAVDSGTLQSADRYVYIPASVTQEGFLAQRVSNNIFRLASAQQDRMVTWTCPNTLGKL